jgi:hypothetical protein
MILPAEEFPGAPPQTPAGGKLPPAPAIRAALHAARSFAAQRSGRAVHFVAPERGLLALQRSHGDFAAN